MSFTKSKLLILHIILILYSSALILINALNNHAYSLYLMLNIVLNFINKKLTN